jgi:hypothetical protein
MGYRSFRSRRGLGWGLWQSEAGGLACLTGQRIDSGLADGRREGVEICARFLLWLNKT